MAEKTKSEYEKIGRMLVSIGELGYTDMKRLYRLEFFKGIVRGLGITIGATIVFSMLVVAYDTLAGTPIIGDFINYVEDVFTGV